MQIIIGILWKLALMFKLWKEYRYSSRYIDVRIAPKIYFYALKCFFMKLHINYSKQLSNSKVLFYWSMYLGIMYACCCFLIEENQIKLH